MKPFKKLITFFIRWLTKTREATDHSLCEYEKIRFEIKPCDVILVQGYSRADRVISLITRCHWTHCALYIGRLIDIDDSDLKNIIGHFYHGPKDTPLVVESRLGAGIVVTSLQSYELAHIRICRPKAIGDKNAQQVIRFAVNRLGVNKDGYYFLDLFRFFFPWSLLPFGWRFGLFRRLPGRHTKNVSAAFIADSFAFIHFPIYPLVKTISDQGVQLWRRHPYLCLPYDIDISPNFDIIKYPFIDFKAYSSERLIPWKGSGIYSGEDAIPLSLQAPKKFKNLEFKKNTPDSNNK